MQSRQSDVNPPLQFVVSAGTQTESASVALICRRGLYKEWQYLSLTDSSFFWGAIICIFLKFPVFRRHLSFLRVGLVQDKGFPLPTSIHGLQKRHLIVAMACLRLCRQGKGFSLSCMQLVQQREIAKFASFPAFSTLDFPGSVLSPFFSQPPSISCYHGEWNACSIQVVGWIGFEVDGWWESLIPPSPNTAPACFLTFHLPETGNQWVGAEKEAGSVLLRCSFTSWMKSAAVRRS